MKPHGTKRRPSRRERRRPTRERGLVEHAHTTNSARTILAAGAAATLGILIAAALLWSSAKRARALQQALAERETQAALTAQAEPSEEALREAALKQIALRDSVTLDPESERAYLLHVEREREAERRAREAERKTREQLAREERVYCLLLDAKREFRQRRYDRALDRYARALELDPQHTDALHGRAVIFARIGELERAAEACDRALAIDPTRAALYVTRGSIKRERGDLEGALADYERALNTDPYQGDALNNRGVVLRLLGREQDALRALKAAERLSPDDPVIQLNCGASYDALDQPERARQAYTQFLKKAAADHATREQVEALFRERGWTVPPRPRRVEALSSETLD